MFPIDLTRRRVFRKRFEYPKTSLADSPSVANDGGSSSPFSMQRLPPIKYPIESTGKPNVVTAYSRYTFNPLADIGRAPSVIDDGAGGSGRSMLPQKVRSQRTHRQSHISVGNGSRLPAILPNFQKMLPYQRFYLQRLSRPLADLKRNIRIAMRRR